MMMALICLARKRHAEEVAAETGVVLPFRSEYADDGFYGGRARDIIRHFREEIRLVAKFGLKYDLAQCTVFLLSGDSFRGDVSGIQELGVQIKSDCEIQMMKTPVSGQQIFMNDFCDLRKEKFKYSVRAVEGLQNKHVAFHLV